MKQQIKKYKNYLIIILIHFVLLFAYFMYRNIDLFFDVNDEIALKSDFSTFFIAQRDEMINFDPFDISPENKSRMSHIYEPLVRFDANLNIESALALSWGKINDNTFEFELRPHVIFHNKDKFNADDVIASFQYARKSNKTDLKNLLANISNIKKINPLTIQIQTITPDPRLLEKLTNLYILSDIVLSKMTNDEIIKTPIGTGPFKFYNWEKNKYLELHRFAQYYKGKPPYKRVVIKVLPNKYSRMLTLQERQTDLLIDVPPAFVKEATHQNNYKIEQVSNLESIFLLFNFNNKYLSNRAIREAIKFGINQKNILKLAKTFALPLTQFTPAGVFGFNPTIKKAEYNRKKTTQLLAMEKIIETITLKMALTEDHLILGQALKQQFNQINIAIELYYLSDQELKESIQKGTYDIYLVGWKFSDADSNEFLKNIVHSAPIKDNEILEESTNIKDQTPPSYLFYGSLNGLNYKNNEVDELIEKGEHEFDIKKRLEISQKIMKIITEDDIIGIPLFEPQKIYAIIKGFNYVPRVDSAIILY